MKGDNAAASPLPLKSINHISLVCRSVEESMDFYANVLGFAPADDPDSLPPGKTVINPKDNHISFQCESMGAVEKKLNEMGIKYVRQRVEEGGIYVDQLFFHDPDGFMVEICNCDNLPVVPLAGEMVRSCSRLNLKTMMQPPSPHVPVVRP